MDKKNKADRLIWRYIKQSHKKNESQTKAEKILTKKL